MAAVMEKSKCEFATQEERVAYLRSHGVEIDLVHDKSGPNRPPRKETALSRVPDKSTPEADQKYFQYVRIPTNTKSAISEERALRDYREGDSLKDWLGPRFANDAEISADVAEREMRGQLDAMVASGQVTAPSTSTLQQVARQSSGTEAYPLAQANETNGFEAVKLYIDEVGALRERPRNARAERIAAETAGLHGLRIHGDAYVGRTMQTPHGIENLDFVLADLEPSSSWALEARRSHAKQFAAMPSTNLKSGSTARYDWSQTTEDVEVSVKLGRSNVNKSMITIDYGRGGTSLLVDCDGRRLVTIQRLFARISPDQSSWTLDDDRIVITLEKTHERDWATLEL